MATKTEFVVVGTFATQVHRYSNVICVKTQDDVNVMVSGRCVYVVKKNLEISLKSFFPVIDLYFKEETGEPVVDINEPGYFADWPLPEKALDYDGFQTLCEEHKFFVLGCSNEIWFPKYLKE